MLITKEIEIDMAHRVPNHKSKCKNLHGHRYKIEVGVDDKVIVESGSSEGMVIDFGDLKETMIRVLDKEFDHNSIFYIDDPIVPGIGELLIPNQDKIPYFVKFIPTAENLAEYWFDLMKQALQQVNIKIKHVKVWETPTSTAIYEEN